MSPPEPTAAGNRKGSARAWLYDEAFPAAGALEMGASELSDCAGVCWTPSPVAPQASDG